MLKSGQINRILFNAADLFNELKALDASINNKHSHSYVIMFITRMQKLQTNVFPSLSFMNTDFCVVNSHQFKTD